MKLVSALHVLTLLFASVAALDYNVTMFKEIYPGNVNSNIYYPFVVGNKLLFQATNPNNGTELWVFDDTIMTDPTLLKDLAPGTSSGYTWDRGMQSFGDVAQDGRRQDPWFTLVHLIGASGGNF